MNATGNAYDWFDQTFRVSQYAFGVPLSLTIIAGNMLLLAVLARDADLRKIITNVQNLAACDLLAGVALGANVATLHMHSKWRTNMPPLCLLWASFQVGFGLTRFNTSCRWQVDKEANNFDLCIARPCQIYVNLIFKHIHTAGINTTNAALCPLVLLACLSLKNIFLSTSS